MEIMNSILKNFSYSLQQLVVPDSQIYWLYLLSSLLITLLIYLLHLAKTEEKKSFLEYYFLTENLSTSQFWMGHHITQPDTRLKQSVAAKGNNFGYEGKALTSKITPFLSNAIR